jgi:hypothetical protein
MRAEAGFSPSLNFRVFQQYRPFAALQYWPYERAESPRKRSSAEGAVVTASPCEFFASLFANAIPGVTPTPPLAHAFAWTLPRDGHAPVAVARVPPPTPWEILLAAGGRSLYTNRPAPVDWPDATADARQRPRLPSRRRRCRQGAVALLVTALGASAELVAVAAPPAPRGGQR